MDYNRRLIFNHKFISISGKLWYTIALMHSFIVFYSCTVGRSVFIMKRPYFDIVASGQKMRDIRKARKISVKQVMEYMGFESTQAVYKWETGRCYPQADNLLALAKLYNVSPMELLVEEDKLSSSCCSWKRSLFFI